MSRRGGMNLDYASNRIAAAFNNQPQQTTNLPTGTRMAEQQSLDRMDEFGRQVKSVRSAGPGWTEVELNNGTVERRTGDRASRNNNPGYIEASKGTHKQPGYVGTDGRFAVFDSVGIGDRKEFVVKP